MERFFTRRQSFVLESIESRLLLSADLVRVPTELPASSSAVSQFVEELVAAPDHGGIGAEVSAFAETQHSPNQNGDPQGSAVSQFVHRAAGGSRRWRDWRAGKCLCPGPAQHGGPGGRHFTNNSDYQILLVANKFQTGFDEPLLCGMYVDRRLAGIQAVQTLSRLNRAHPGKDTTYILDFVNSSEEILAAFKTFYETAELEDVTDPNLVYDLRAKLDGSGHYDDFEVDRVVAVR